MARSEARLRAVLGDDEPTTGVDAGAWADGYGVVAPDVARYAEVLRAVPDAILLAMRNVADAEDLDLVDADSATLLSLLVRSHRPRRVLEVGTGIGFVTLHLVRSVPDDCTITSIDPDPTRQAQAHAFVEHDEHECAIELRLGDPLRLLREGAGHTKWDTVVLTDPELQRLDVLDAVAPNMATDALLAIPFALRGGRVADSQAAWDGDPIVESQRLLNRMVAIDPRFADVTLLPVGDGLLLARRV